MTNRKTLDIQFKFNENDAPAPVNYTLDQLVNILDSTLVDVCLSCDDDLREYDPVVIARITKKAILAIGRMGNLFKQNA